MSSTRVALAQLIQQDPDLRTDAARLMQVLEQRNRLISRKELKALAQAVELGLTQIPLYTTAHAYSREQMTAHLMTMVRALRAECGVEESVARSVAETWSHALGYPPLRLEVQARGEQDQPAFSHDPDDGPPTKVEDFVSRDERTVGLDEAPPPGKPVTRLILQSTPLPAEFLPSPAPLAAALEAGAEKAEGEGGAAGPGAERESDAVAGVDNAGVGGAVGTGGGSTDGEIHGNAKPDNHGVGSASAPGIGDVKLLAVVAPMPVKNSVQSARVATTPPPTVLLPPPPRLLRGGPMKDRDDHSVSYEVQGANDMNYPERGGPQQPRALSPWFVLIACFLGTTLGGIVTAVFVMNIQKRQEVAAAAPTPKQYPAQTPIAPTLAPNTPTPAPPTPTPAPLTLTPVPQTPAAAQQTPTPPTPVPSAGPIIDLSRANQAVDGKDTPRSGTSGAAVNPVSTITVQLRAIRDRQLASMTKKFLNPQTTKLQDAGFEFTTATFTDEDAKVIASEIPSTADFQLRSEILADALLTVLMSRFGSQNDRTAIDSYYVSLRDSIREAAQMKEQKDDAWRQLERRLRSTMAAFLRTYRDRAFNGGLDPVTAEDCPLNTVTLRIVKITHEEFRWNAGLPPGTAATPKPKRDSNGNGKGGNKDK